MRVKRLLPFLLLFSIAAPLFSQAITATAVGTVTDPTGAVAPNAKVTIRSRQTNQARATTTDSAGAYEFSFLPVGPYGLTVEAAGFQKSEVGQFTLSVDQVSRLDVKMTLGQSAETVQVQASAILMQTENATVGTVIDS